MHHRLKTPLIAAAAAALLLVLAGCSQKAPAKSSAPAPAAPKTFKIGYLPITHSAPLLLEDAAADTGVKVDLVKFGSWPELTDALNAGRIDGAVTMLELALGSSAKGVPLKLVALSHRDGDALTVAKDIGGVSGLKGKRVAIPHRMSGQNILLKLALEKAGLSNDDVQRIEMAPAEMPAALGRGDISGYIVAEPFGTLGVLKAGGKTLLRASELWPDWPCCGLVLRGDVVASQPKDVQKLVDGFVAAGGSIEADPGKATATAAKYTQYDANVWAKSLALGVRYDDLTPKAEELAKLQDSLVVMNLLPKPADLSVLLDDSFVRKAYGN